VTKGLGQVRAGAADMKKQWLAILISSVLIGPTLAHAVLLVDTGTPPTITNNYLYRFVAQEYFGAQFTIASSYVITSIEGYVSNDLGPEAGTVLAEIYHDRDGYNSPGERLFSTPFALARFAHENWYGVFGLNWVIDSGTYWVAFVPDTNIEGLQRGAAGPFPLLTDLNSNGVWLGLSDYGGQGWRINASLPSTPKPVPEPGALALILLGLAGIAYRRQRR
jgi:hypothetical protein